MELSFLQGVAVAGVLSSYTFAGQNLGAEAANRYIIVCVQSRKGGAVATAVSSLTVGGVTATEVIQQAVSSTNGSLAAIYIALVPTGLAGDVVVNLLNTQARCSVSLYRATGISPTATFTTYQAASTAIGLVDVLTNGAVISAGAVAASAATAQYNITMDYDSSIGGNGRATSGSSSKLPQQAGRPVTVAFASGADPIAVFAAFQPSDKGAFFSLFE